MKRYRDFYGCHAVIRTSKNGSARLTVRNPYGKLIKTQDYSTERGAKIAMGRMGDGWTERWET